MNERRSLLVLISLSVLALVVACFQIHRQRVMLDELGTIVRLRDEAYAASQSGDPARAATLYEQLAELSSEPERWRARIARTPNAPANVGGVQEQPVPWEELMARNAVLQEEVERYKRRELELRKGQAMPLVPLGTKDTPPSTGMSGESNGLLRFNSGKKNEAVIYVGQIVSGVAQGQGTGVWRSGSVYTGAWVNNQRHGSGEFQWVDGERYVGEHVNDKRVGQGTYYWRNGQYWTGIWENDMRHGPGVLYEADGEVRVQGEWKKDRLTTPTKKPMTTRTGE